MRKRIALFVCIVLLMSTVLTACDKKLEDTSLPVLLSDNDLKSEGEQMSSIKSPDEFFKKVRSPENHADSLQYLDGNIEAADIGTRNLMLEEYMASLASAASEFYNVRLQELCTRIYDEGKRNPSSTGDFANPTDQLNGYVFSDYNKAEIKSLELMAYIDQLESIGLRVQSQEGFPYLTVNYESFLKKYASYMKDEFADYIKIMELYHNSAAFDDAAITVSWDALAERIVQIEAYLKKHSNSARKDELLWICTGYLRAYLIGTDNTPAFDYRTHKIDEGLFQSYESSIKRFDGSRLCAILNEYLSLLRKMNYSFDYAETDNEIWQFVDGASYDL